MKKIHTLLFVLIFPFCSYSQVNEINFNHQNFDISLPPRTNISPMSIRLLDNYNNGGPTGYGSVLEIYGLAGHQTGQLYFGGWDNSRIRYREAFYAQSTWSDWITLLDSKNDVESIGNLKITGNANSYILNGNVGIGTTTPTAKFEIYNTAQAGHLLLTANDNPNADATRIDIDFRVANHGHTVGRISSSYDTSANGGSGGLRFYTRDKGSLIENVRINSIGNVGIGSTNPDQKLTVKGKIHAEEIIVDLSVPADYVFQKYYTGKSTLKSDYVMPTLAEIESFTKKNHHLPNVPSAREVQQNGVSLGTMSNVLLQKVEELTLYAIEQNKKIMLQQEELERLKKENENYKSLAERLSMLENALKKQ